MENSEKELVNGLGAPRLLAVKEEPVVNMVEGEGIDEEKNVIEERFLVK